MGAPTEPSSVDAAGSSGPELRDVDDLEKIYASYNENDADLWGIENFSFHDKIVDVFEIPEGTELRKPNTRPS